MAIKVTADESLSKEALAISEWFYVELDES